MYSGRESVSTRGTLRIRRSQVTDTGNYTVRVDTISNTQRATGWPEIGELEIPGISVNTSSMAENVDSVAAICHTSATDDKWYVSYTQVSNYDPDSKMLII